MPNPSKVPRRYRITRLHPAYGPAAVERCRESQRQTEENAYNRRMARNNAEWRKRQGLET